MKNRLIFCRYIKKVLSLHLQLRRHAVLTVFNDNSTRLAYRKICPAGHSFFITVWQIRNHVPIDEQIELLKQRGMLVGDEVSLPDIWLISATIV